MTSSSLPADAPSHHTHPHPTSIITRILAHLRRLPTSYLLILILIALLLRQQPTLPLPFLTHSTTDCSLSLRESHNFICATPSSWHRRKQKFIHQQLQQNSTSQDRHHVPQRFWQRNYEPNFSCEYERRLGDAGDGGKWVCNPDDIAQVVKAGRKKCIVYSIGSANHFDFEERIWEWVKDVCEIHTFDHTVKTPRNPKFVNFHRWGLGGVDDEANSLFTLETIMRKLGHDNPELYTLEILKVDIEQHEYEALLPVMEKKGGVFDTMARQLLIEVHMPINEKDPPERDPATGRVVRRWDKIHRFFEVLYGKDWVIFHKEPNLLMKGELIEYAFLKLDWGSAGMVNEFMKEKGVGYRKR